MSNINPQNIDGTFPIAGQDNNSQGFRDNFTNTINNFTFAAAELTDLQTYAVLTAPLSSVGQTGTPTNNMNYTYLTKPQLKGAVETTTDLGTIGASGSFSVDWSVAHYQTVNLTTAATMSFASTWPTTNLWTKLRLEVTTTNTTALTLPATVTVNIANIQGYTSGTTLSLPAGTYVFEFSTKDNGSTVTIEDVLRNYGTSAALVSTGNLVIAGGMVQSGYQIFKPTANVAIQANVSVSRVVLAPTPAGGIVSFFADITLPNVKVDGTLISISSNVAVNTLRVLPNWNTTVSPSSNITLTAGSVASFLYHSTDNKWFKVA